MVAPTTLPSAPPSAGSQVPAEHRWVERLAAQHGVRIRGMLRRMLGNEDEVLDVYQDCLFHLVRRSEDISARDLRAYAYRTAANLAVESIRSRQRRRLHHGRFEPARGAAFVSDGADGRERNAVPGGACLDELRRALPLLPRRLRDVVVLRDLLQMPYARVADMLGIQPGIVWVYRREAIVRLGVLLGAAAAGPASTSAA